VVSVSTSRVRLCLSEFVGGWWTHGKSVFSLSSSYCNDRNGSFQALCMLIVETEFWEIHCYFFSSNNITI
jgi:hypothetical protein